MPLLRFPALLPTAPYNLDAIIAAFQSTVFDEVFDKVLANSVLSYPHDDNQSFPPDFLEFLEIRSNADVGVTDWDGEYLPVLSSSHHKDPDEDAAVHTGRISDAIFGKAIEDFTSVLDEFKNNLLLAHWPHKGTLIALLRYGRIIGDLGDGIEDQVDYDLDWMVEGDSEEKWFLLVMLLTDRLIGSGWLGCYFRAHQMGVGEIWGILPLGYTVLTCVPDESSGIEVDVQFLMRDGSELRSLRNELKAWDGRLPVDLVHPLRQCSAYSITVTCPAKFEELLAHWVGGEYRTSEWCLALPNWGSAERFISNPRHHTMVGGLTNSHIEKLVDIWRQIDETGAASMSSVWKSSSACLQARSELAQKGCIGCDVKVEAEIGGRLPKPKAFGNLELAKAFIGQLKALARPAEGLLLRQCHG